MKTLVRATLRLASLFTVAGASAALAFQAGGFAYTKRVETNVLSEPRALAASAGKLGYHRKVKVTQVQGAWLRVSDGLVAGWVFAGNLADTMPAEIKGADGLPVSASQTTASAAARPLTPAADDYAERRSLGDARKDLDWLNDQCKAVTSEQVDAYLQTAKKGEYQ